MQNMPLEDLVEIANKFGDSMKILSDQISALGRQDSPKKDLSGGTASSKPHKIAAAKKRHAKKKANRKSR